MFGNLFEEGEDFDFVSESKGINGRKSRKKDHELPAPRAACNLSGIKNQGGTCYLNSLLQTLLYTPEFRESLFALGPEELGCLSDKDKPESKVRVIPLELQRLFAQLLLADQLAASTTDLTDSFGWTGNEQTSQHDVQELNRILFSALECSLVGTSGHDLINRLYHGIVVNKIVCKECGNVSERQEDFLDLTVTVKGVSGLEEALCNLYVEEEHFDNDNLYRCGRCEKLVKATKSAKLRHLPTFLTVSLLRFNYDFVKSERYKETGCYTFPVRLAMQPFCEQGDLEDVEFEYELFSVIIHKGGCYGGHYHAYIKDIDQLGTWFSPVNVLDLRDPLETLRAILVQVGPDGLLVDQLGQKLLEKVGFAWNKRYRKQHGPIKKFLESHPAVFLLKSDGTRVSVKQPANCCPEQQSNKSKAKKTPANGSAQSCSPDIRWFNFDDSQVRPIHEKNIEKQFQGKESAYMLFYRKSHLQRTSAAKGNPRYKVPLHLQEEMANYDAELKKQRMEFDSAVNNIEVHLHLGPEYTFVNGALHPASSQKDSVLTLTIDRRKTIGDLRQSAFQLLEFWEGDMVIHIAKQLPAGLHLYERLDGKPEFVADVLLIIALCWPNVIRHCSKPHLVHFYHFFSVKIFSICIVNLALFLFSSTELLLQLWMAVPGESSYYPPEDFIFDTSKECTARTLRHKIAQRYSLTVEQIEIAKYFPEKSTWMPISSWSQQVSKKKRKKKPENLQGAPNHLKDGDIIGVKVKFILCTYN
uniref:Ubiquitin carboxyl-terminal hydrolase n=1 Tax=Callorhinchus milii TaxID=7868 RepID=A0A4W3HWR1_CALMI